LASSRAGQRILAARPDLASHLADRKALAALPDGSLGRAYLAFMEEDNLTAEFLVDASKKGGVPHEGDEVEHYVGRRMRDAHDLWHVVPGYKGDLLGEASVLAFTFAQTWAPAIGLLVGAAYLRSEEPDARRMMIDAFARGLRSAWFPAVPWEEMLAMPVDEV